MTDPETLSTEDLLRMIGRELQATRRAAEQTRQYVGFLLGIVVFLVIAAFVVGFVSAEDDGPSSLFGLLA